MRLPFRFKLHRCRFDRKFLGVCGGMGQLFSVDPALIRVALVFLASLTAFFPIAILYLVVGLILPNGPLVYVNQGHGHLFRAKRGRIITGLCAGMGRYFKINAFWVRSALCALAALTFFIPVMVAYFIASQFVPEAPPKG